MHHGGSASQHVPRGAIDGVLRQQLSSMAGASNASTDPEGRMGIVSGQILLLLQLKLVLLADKGLALQGGLEVEKVLVPGLEHDFSFER